jgi:chemotaxis response regulator CheB
MRILVVSPHAASRALLSRFLAAESDVEVSATGEPDDALASIAEHKPALVVVDLRRPDEDHPLFVGLLRKRYPTLPVVSLVPGRLRIFDGRTERVREAHGDTAEALHHLMNCVRLAVQDLLAQHLLRMLRPPVGRA